MVQAHTRIIEGIPLAAPVPSVTVPQFVRQSARERPDKTALVDATSGRSITYGALDRLIGRFAAGLVAHGFAPREVLVLFLPNLPEWPIAALGAMCAGGIVSGANPTISVSDLARQLRDTGARFVVTIPLFLETVRAAAAEVGGHVSVILLGDALQTMPFAQLLACTDPEPQIAPDPDTLAALPFSSGTSGVSKGVMLTHRNLVANCCQCLQVLALPQSAVSLAFLPMFHIYGFTVILVGGLANGITLVTMPRFEPEPFLKALQDYRVTNLGLVPPVLHFLANHPLVASYDLSSLQKVGCGAAPLGGSLEQKASERLHCDVAQGFGMTESSGVVAATYPEKIRRGSSGQLLPGTQARVVDPITRTDLERGVPGEIWFRGPQAFMGYLNNPRATAEAITDDGWVRTGDIGYFDGDDYLFITDRLKELIKVKGFQVAPAELEALLYTHPLVADAAVIARPDERAGELPVAYVVSRGQLGAEDLKTWVAERVGEYKRLADVVFCEVIPKSPAGKILRRVLRAQDAQRVGARAA
ncbi:MAG TPA: AMP-binding protein [Burkholderiaceae bacterium]|nr:AMP-binding protein [Burkholderiaceae bacterium]